MPQITMYSKMLCPFCHRAKKLLKQKGAAFEEIDITWNASRRNEMLERADGHHTVPQIFIGDTHVGGCDELYQLEAEGRLDPLLAGSA